MDWKDIIIRALKTLAQTFISLLIASLAGVNMFAADVGDNFWIGVLLSAVAGAVSAAWNVILEAIKVNKTQ
jgi:hypothetical protein